MAYTYLEKLSGKAAMSDSALTEKLQAYLELEKQKDALEAQLQAALGDLRSAAGKSTFKVGEQWYQVRVRSGLRYMCQLDGPPRGRPRKSEAKPATPPPAPPAAPEDS